MSEFAPPRPRRTQLQQLRESITSRQWGGICRRRPERGARQAMHFWISCVNVVTSKLVLRANLDKKKIGHASCPVELRQSSYVGVQSKMFSLGQPVVDGELLIGQIGRASCRERA